MRKIAVLRGGAIGDFIVTIPAISAIRCNWPSARLTLVAYPRMARLAVETGLADEFISLDSAALATLFAADPDPAAISEPFAKFDVIVSFLNDPDGTARRNLSAAGSPQVFCLTPLVKSENAPDHFTGILPNLGIPRPPEAIPVIPLNKMQIASGRRLAAGFGSRVLAMHAGSGSPAKNWPADRFIALAGAAREKLGLTPVFTIGEADDKIADALARAGNPFPELVNVDLLDLACFLANCTAYVGNDSGITHLAAAVGTNTVVLFGPSNPAVWAPRGSNVVVLKAREPTAECLGVIEPSRVLAALTSFVSCSGTTHATKP